MADIDISISKSKNVIAPDFKPTFRSCDLAVFCNNPTPKAKINFFRKYEAFVDHCPKILPKPVQQKKVYLTNEDKVNMQKELDKSLANNSLSFNDEAIINIGLESVKKMDDLSFMMSQLLMTDDSDSPEENVDYDTCESDEEFFKKNVETEKSQRLEELIRIKTKQARFYTSTQRGIKIEKAVILKVNLDRGFNFHQNKQLIEQDFGSFKIHGIIDGIDPEKRTVIEVKSRNKFDANKCTITEKEKIQSLVYMKLYDCDKCLFVESGPDGNQKIKEIEWNEEKFNREVLNKLEKFTNYARSLTKEDFKDLIEKCNIT
jgi:hypothetical protein